MPDSSTGRPTPYGPTRGRSPGAPSATGNGPITPPPGLEDTLATMNRTLHGVTRTLATLGLQGAKREQEQNNPRKM